MALARSVDVAIVGGGIVGASCAYSLAERGAAPLLLEAGRAGREASGVNAGGVRQQARLLPEMPLALASLPLWADLEKGLDNNISSSFSNNFSLAWGGNESQSDSLV